MPFNHNEPHNGAANSAFMHPYIPWGAQNVPFAAGAEIRTLNTMEYAPSAPVPFVVIGWPAPPVPHGPMINAVHMSLIPKGPYRGMVLVWTGGPPALIQNPAFAPQLPGSSRQSFQPYAIVDPADAPVGGIRYRNFLLPMGVYAFSPSSPILGEDIFCSGHTWTQFGDLIVAGGTDYYTAVPAAQAAKTTIAFNPRQPFADYPASTTNPYPGAFGLWKRGADLTSGRWYATVTRTMRLPRLANASNPEGRETVLVLGGTTDTSNYTAAANPTWNSYEALVIDAEASAGSAGYSPDIYPHPITGLLATEWPGPGTTAGTHAFVDVDWFEEYPRTHLLSTRQVAVSGYAPRWSMLDHEFPGFWTISPGQPAGSGTYSSNWQDVRHDGSSVLFPNLGGQLDIVLRLGGSNHHWWTANPTPVLTTPSAESLQAGASSAAWQAAPDMPTTHDPVTGRDGGRFLCNAVLLPTGGVLVLGGVHCNGPYFQSKAFVYKPQIFENGSWQTYAENPVPGGSPRDYHSTAVLLPDGRVFIGGGNERLYDYEIFSPPYLNKPQNRPTSVAWANPAPALDLNFDAHILDWDETRTIRCNPLPLGHAIQKIVFMAPGSVTHHSDMHQRYFETIPQVQGGNVATFRTPASESELPRGIYMMFLVTNAPSVSQAEWVVFQ